MMSDNTKEPAETKLFKLNVWVIQRKKIIDECFCLDLEAGITERHSNDNKRKAHAWEELTNKLKEPKQ